MTGRNGREREWTGMRQRRIERKGKDKRQEGDREECVKEGERTGRNGKEREEGNGQE